MLTIQLRFFGESLIINTKMLEDFELARVNFDINPILILIKVGSIF